MSAGELTALLREAEAALVHGLDLVPVPLDPALSTARGAWKGAPAHLAARAYRGGPLRYARFVELGAGPLEIGNLLCLSRPELPLPIFGADLVALGSGAAMLAADLSPVLPPGPSRDAQLADLAALRARGPALPPGGALPDYCARWFSPHALYTRVGAEGMAAAAQVFRGFTAAFLKVCAGVPRPASRQDAVAQDAVAQDAVAQGAAEQDAAEQDAAARTAEAQAGYGRAHQQDDKGLGLLARMFGAPWASRFVPEVLFPAP